MRVIGCIVSAKGKPVEAVVHCMAETQQKRELLTCPRIQNWGSNTISLDLVPDSKAQTLNLEPSCKSLGLEMGPSSAMAGNCYWVPRVDSDSVSSGQDKIERLEVGPQLPPQCVETGVSQCEKME